VRTGYEGDAITLDLRNLGGTVAQVRIADAYTGQRASLGLRPGESSKVRYPLDGSFGWYDLTITVESDAGFRQQIAGHVETGLDSMTDPLLGAG